MKKKSEEELGILLTREVIKMMFADKLKDSQKVKIFQAVVTGGEIGDPVLDSFAESLKSGYDFANKARFQSIENRRERQRAYMRDRRASTEIGGDEDALLLKGKGKGKKIPLSPEGEKGVPTMISPEELMGGDSVRVSADRLTKEVLEWYPYNVTEGKLKDVLIRIMEKDSPARVAEGFAKWKGSEEWSEARFIPRRIVSWFADGGWAVEPTQKKSPARESVSAEATANELESED